MITLIHFYNELSDWLDHIIDLIITIQSLHSEYKINN